MEKPDPWYMMVLMRRCFLLTKPLQIQ
jgi:hypothetical protein